MTSTPISCSTIYVWTRITFPFFIMLIQCLDFEQTWCKICGIIQTILSNLTEQISKSSSEWCKSQAVYSRSSHWRSWNSACGRLEPCDVAQLIVFKNGNGIIFDYETFEQKRSNIMPQTICSSSPRFSNPHVIPIDFLIPKEFGSVKRDWYLWFCISWFTDDVVSTVSFNTAQSCGRHTAAFNKKRASLKKD